VTLRILPKPVMTHMGYKRRYFSQLSIFNGRIFKGLRFPDHSDAMSVPRVKFEMDGQKYGLGKYEIVSALDQGI